MKLKTIFDFIIQEGIAADPRPKSVIQETLDQLKDHYHFLSASEKEYFDPERLRNPYADTRIVSADPDADARIAMVGIDMDTPELLLVDHLNRTRKKKIDLVISHHPQGRAYANFYDVMNMQADIYSGLGVPINISERLVEERKKEVERKIHSANHNRAADAARWLNISLACVHTPADNHAATYLTKLFDQKKPKTLKEVLRIIQDIEEYRMARKNGTAPVILLGTARHRPGKIFVDMTGGTEGPKDIIDSLLAAGVGTVVGMHLSEEHYKLFRDKQINVIIAGHIASDNLGMNLLLDKVERFSKMEILACSGFKRIKRCKP